MTQTELQVLADHLRTVLSEQDAADVAKWAANVKQVRRLIEWNVRSFTRSQEARACPECDESMIAGYLHRRDCLIASDLRVVYPLFAEMEIEEAHEEAIRQHTQRFPVRPVNGANPGDLVEVAVGPSGQMRMTAVVARMVGTLAHAVANGIEQPYRLASESQDRANQREQHAAIFRGRGIADGALAAQARFVPADMVRVMRDGQPHLEPEGIFRSRNVSDARGMEAVETEARQLEGERTSLFQRQLRAAGR